MPELLEWSAEYFGQMGFLLGVHHALRDMFWLARESFAVADSMFEVVLSVALPVALVVALFAALVVARFESGI